MCFLVFIEVVRILVMWLLYIILGCFCFLVSVGIDCVRDDGYGRIEVRR